MIRIEANYIETRVINSVNVYTYEFRFVNSTTLWGNLPPLSGWGTYLDEYEPISKNAFEVLEHIPAELEPPEIGNTPSGTPKLYRCGIDIRRADIPSAWAGLYDWDSIMLFMESIRGAYAYYVEQHPYDYPIVIPDTIPPNGWYRMPEGNSENPYYPPEEWANVVPQTIYYRNTQTMVCEFYPEFLFPFDGAIPGPSHLLYYLDTEGWNAQVSGNGTYRLQKLGSAYGGREEYILNYPDEWQLPEYVNYNWTYLPPYPGHSAGESEIWWIDIMKPAPTQYPVKPWEEPPIPPPPGKLPDDRIIFPPVLSKKKEEKNKKGVVKTYKKHYGTLGYKHPNNAELDM